ncbi:MAG: hypothetical protein M1396_06240, partial [Chloroflexi bacterium]|nr:hypothetical protein [Chloroflexota bacterium]
MISIVRAATDRGQWSSRRPDLLALLLLVLIVLWFTGPVVLHPGSWLYGKGQDGFGAPAALAENLWYHHFPTPLWQPHGLLGVPFSSIPGAGAIADPLWWNTATLLAFITRSPIAAANLMIFLGILLTPLVFYGFCRSTGFSPFASFLAAVIYGFAPQRIAQAQQHFLLLDGFWFVLLLALLLSLWKSSDIWKGILIGIVLGMTELDNPYLAYFALLATGASFLVLLICRVQQSIRREVFLLFMTGIASLATTALIVIPLQFPALLQASSTPSFRSANSPLHRPLSDLNSYSLRWWDFLLPFPENPIIGPLGRQTFAAHVGAANETEMSVMTGYIALALACTGALAVLRTTRPIPEQPNHRWSPNLTQRRLALLAGTWIITGILFGLPPLFQIGAVTIPAPPYFTHAIFPEIRTLSRSDLLIQLGIAIFAAFGAQAIYARLRSLPQRSLLAAALSIGILLEYTNVPPWHYAKLLPVPKVYRWLASLSPQQAGIVVQYPLQPAYLSHTAFYAFYDYAVYHHPLFNGVPSDTPPDYLRNNLADI